MTVQSQSKQGDITKVLAILGDPRPRPYMSPYYEHRVWQAERIVALFAAKQGEGRA